MFNLLPFCIHVFHVFVVMYITLVPFFIEIPMFLILHITSCVSLLTHWAYNNNSCSLTLLECHLRGIKPQDAVSHRFIAPVYNIVSDNDWTAILYVSVVLLMLISIYKLYNIPAFSYVYNSYLEQREALTQLPWQERWLKYILLARPLFI